MNLFCKILIAKRSTLSLRETSKKIGISLSSLSRAENGQELSIETFYAISKWIDLDIGFLLECYMDNIAEIQKYNGPTPKGRISDS